MKDNEWEKSWIDKTKNDVRMNLKFFNSFDLNHIVISSSHIILTI